MNNVAGPKDVYKVSKERCGDCGYKTYAGRWGETTFFGCSSYPDCQRDRTERREAWLRDECSKCSDRACLQDYFSMTKCQESKRAARTKAMKY